MIILKLVVHTRCEDHRADASRCGLRFDAASVAIWEVVHARSRCVLEPWNDDGFDSFSTQRTFDTHHSSRAPKKACVVHVTFSL